MYCVIISIFLILLVTIRCLQRPPTMREELTVLPTLFLHPVGGLCNRLRVIACGVEMAKRRNMHLRIIWDVVENLNANFEDIFEFPLRFISYDDIPRKHELKHYTSLSNAMNSKYLKHVQNRLLSVRHLDEIPLSSSSFLVTSQHYICNRKSASYVAVLRTILMSMKDRLKDRAIAVLRDHGREGNNVGIHYRSVDIVKGVRKVFERRTSLDELSEKITVLRKQRPHSVIFLCTDDEANLQTLKRKHSHVYSIPRQSFDRNDIKAIEDAASDLYLLLLCNKHILSPGSSFSNIVKDAS